MIIAKTYHLVANLWLIEQNPKGIEDLIAISIYWILTMVRYEIKQRLKNGKLFFL